MKYTLLLITTLFLNSCTDPELERLKARTEEARCKADLAESILKYENTFEMVARTFPKSVKEYQKLQQDSTISCDSLKRRWDALCDSARAIK